MEVETMIEPEDFNRWRVIPRLIVGLYGFTFWKVAEWFMGLPEPTAPQAQYSSLRIIMIFPFHE